MATIIGYVRGPLIAGWITGLDYYCEGGTEHEKCEGMNKPIDVGGQGYVYLSVNYPNIKSIRTWIGLLCCENSACGDDYKRVVIVDLFANYNAQCWIGKVLYGHIKNPQVSNGTIYNLSGPTKALGTAIGVTPCLPCSTGSHVHMEMMPIWAYSATAEPLVCNAQVTTATKIYKFLWDSNCPT